MLFSIQKQNIYTSLREKIKIVQSINDCHDGKIKNALFSNVDLIKNIVYQLITEIENFYI